MNNGSNKINKFDVKRTFVHIFAQNIMTMSIVCTTELDRWRVSKEFGDFLDLILTNISNLNVIIE